MKTTFIYTLSDPVTHLIRYVGKSNNPRKRLQYHITDANKCHKTSWIKSLNGELPILGVIDEVLISEWGFWEQYWIAQIKCWGFDLVNMDMGGLGGDSLTEHQKQQRYTSEVRAKMAIKATGRKWSDASRKKASKSHTGLKASLQTKEKHSVIKTGSKNPFFGMTHTEEVKTRIAEAVSLNARQGHHSSAKLNIDDVLNIRHLYNNTNMTLRELAKKYNVSIPTISRIVDYKSWKYI